jgi:hypothetical protein
MIFSFDRLITPALGKILYGFLCSLSVVAGIAAGIFAASGSGVKSTIGCVVIGLIAGVLATIVCIILARIFIEFLLVNFLIHEELVLLRKNRENF